MKLNYCPECAAPLKQETPTEYTCQNGHPYYNNPAAAVGIIILRPGNEALFSQRGREPKKDLYDFPGGFVEYGEHPMDAALRELKEETGLTPHDLTMAGTAAINHYQENKTTCDFLFVCTDWSGETDAQDDVAALEWKPLSFMETEQFAWPYDGVYEYLTQYIQENLPHIARKA